jgi:hypothetical protein
MAVLQIAVLQMAGNFATGKGKTLENTSAWYLLVDLHHSQLVIQVIDIGKAIHQIAGRLGVRLFVQVAEQPEPIHRFAHRLLQ